MDHLPIFESSLLCRAAIGFVGREKLQMFPKKPAAPRLWFAMGFNNESSREEKQAADENCGV